MRYYKSLIWSGDDVICSTPFTCAFSTLQLSEKRGVSKDCFIDLFYWLNPHICLYVYCHGAVYRVGNSELASECC